MPFERYLQDNNTSVDVTHYPNAFDDSYPPNPVQFRIPPYLIDGPPTLAQGGGAEVLPLASSWIANNGFEYPTPLQPSLPIYSASGFDLISILARVVSRPHPSVILGPVDMSCSFVVVDVRRYDNPIVYASPTFCRLTGYDESEVLGRNCRFLQSPTGVVHKGDPRRYTEGVAHLRKSLAADKECQASIINYRKDGSAFINWVTVIPISGGVSNTPAEANDIVYHVGFQVDLTEQPNAVRYKNPSIPRRSTTVHQNPISKDLCTLLPTLESPPDLSLLLLSSLPDFILVVSLKGSFLYVAPAVQRVLGYTADELMGKSLAEYCHPADIVPLMRELKESSATPGLTSPPRTVDLLFRVLSKDKGYVWVECRGRLHVEPGKGRKAIILSGRPRDMPALTWGCVASAGGLARDGSEFWGVVSGSGVFLVASVGVRDVLGWGAGEVIGTALEMLVVDGGCCVEGVERGGGPRVGYCQMQTKTGGVCDVHIVFYSSSSSPSAPLILQVKLASSVEQRAPRLAHALDTNMFEELEMHCRSSWQYELQQVKFANARLREEVERLEKARGCRRGGGGAAQPALPSTPAATGSSSSYAGERGLAEPATRSLVSVAQSWDTLPMVDTLGMGIEMGMGLFAMPQLPQRSMKRSWDMLGDIGPT